MVRVWIHAEHHEKRNKNPNKFVWDVRDIDWKSKIILNQHSKMGGIDRSPEITNN